MPTRNYVIRTYRKFPRQLFRLNNGPYIRLREYKSRRSPLFNVLANDKGNIEPKALDPATYVAPNGASMRPNTISMHNITKVFRAPQAMVFSIPRGTPLPDNLILVHEHNDHYSLQPAEEMTLDHLNHSITSFFESHGTKFTKAEWLAKYASRPAEDV